jgi:hypothetical protein
LEPQFVEISKTVANTIRNKAIDEQNFYYHYKSDSRSFKKGDQILLITNPGYAPDVKYWLVKV